VSRYSGADRAMPSTWANYGRGARSRFRALKRFEAEQRNAATPAERTAKFRRDRARVQAALADAREPGASS
jgi:hypothetical protein